MDLIKLLADQYKITAIRLKELEGYDSVNFRVNSESGTYVLKQYPYSKAIKEELEAENAILEKLSSLKNQEFPRAVPTKNGDFLYCDASKMYRLLTFIEGDFLGDVTHTPSLLYSFGEFMAKLNKQLKGAYFAPIAAKNTQWDLQYFKQNYKYLEHISDPGDRSLVDYFFLQFDQQIYPIQSELRKTIIHNDGNDWNVLTKNGKVSGIIDFGDMCHSWLINELAVALTYVMMGKEDPLKIASVVLYGYHQIVPLQKEELDILYYLVAARLCTSVCNSAYSKKTRPDSDYITISEKPAWKLLRKWITINPLKASSVFRKVVGYEQKGSISFDAQYARRTKVLSGALSLSYQEPIQMKRAAFQYMYDVEGNTFLDAYNNIMLVGHTHPTVVRAAQEKMAQLNTNTRYLYDELLEYSERLLKKFPSNLNKVFFVNSGSAASDLAVRLARTFTKKKKLMVVEHGYHGNTQQGIAISHYKYNHKGGAGKQDHILQTPMPNAYGSGFKDDGSAGVHFAKQAQASIADNENEIAAFIAEPIVGCGGQVPLAKGYLTAVYKSIRAQGGVCISDEVQVGFGRLGECFWGFEMHNVIPDMVLLGKPMGNGHPIAAVVTTTEIAERFDNGLEFFSSFGGNPVSCVVGNAVLQVVENEGLQEHARKTGNYLKSRLQELQQKYPQLDDVRGNGLFLGVEILDSNNEPGTELASHIKNELRRKHILIGTDGPFESVLKIKPPLPFTTLDCDLLCEAIDEILEDFHKN